jgi:hypothetical protein
VIDKTRSEALAIEHAGLVASEFVQERIAEGLGSDIAQWPRDAYFVFVECAITAFVERMQELKNVPAG